MKKSLLVRLILLLVATITLSGCVVVPWGWDDGGYRCGGCYDRGPHGWYYGRDGYYHRGRY